MATNIVFLIDHVSDVPRDGSKILRRVTALTMDKKDRIRKDIVLDIKRGNGNPDENNNM